jgi:hypothetical protein
MPLGAAQLFSMSHVEAAMRRTSTSKSETDDHVIEYAFQQHDSKQHYRKIARAGTVNRKSELQHRNKMTKTPKQRKTTRE